MFRRRPMSYVTWWRISIHGALSHSSVYHKAIGWASISEKTTNDRRLRRFGLATSRPSRETAGPVRFASSDVDLEAMNGYPRRNARHTRTSTGMNGYPRRNARRTRTSTGMNGYPRRNARRTRTSTGMNGYPRRNARRTRTSTGMSRSDEQRCYAAPR
jgi:hypothetical protein